jgi:hypothetical protein
VLPSRVWTLNWSWVLKINVELFFWFIRNACWNFFYTDKLMGFNPLRYSIRLGLHPGKIPGSALDWKGHYSLSHRLCFLYMGRLFAFIIYSGANLTAACHTDAQPNMTHQIKFFAPISMVWHLCKGIWISQLAVPLLLWSHSHPFPTSNSKSHFQYSILFRSRWSHEKWSLFAIVLF